jgi:hypothetical protein
VQQNGPVARHSAGPRKKELGMHGYIYNRRVRQPRHHERHTAALRVFTGAKLLLDIAVIPRSRCEAAQLVASTPIDVTNLGNTDRVVAGTGATRFADSLKAVAVFATGGVKALAAQKSEAAQLLLAQVKK